MIFTLCLTVFCIVEAEGSNHILMPLNSASVSYVKSLVGHANWTPLFKSMLVLPDKEIYHGAKSIAQPNEDYGLFVPWHWQFNMTQADIPTVTRQAMMLHMEIEDGGGKLSEINEELTGKHEQYEKCRSHEPCRLHIHDHLRRWGIELCFDFSSGLVGQCILPHLKPWCREETVTPCHPFPDLVHTIFKGLPSFSLLRHRKKPDARPDLIGRSQAAMNDKMVNDRHNIVVGPGDHVMPANLLPSLADIGRIFSEELYKVLERDGEPDGLAGLVDVKQGGPTRVNLTAATQPAAAGLADMVGILAQMAENLVVVVDSSLDNLQQTMQLVGSSASNFVSDQILPVGIMIGNLTASTSLSLIDELNHSLQDILLQQQKEHQHQTQNQQHEETEVGMKEPSGEVELEIEPDVIGLREYCSVIHLPVEERVRVLQDSHHRRHMMLFDDRQPRSDDDNQKHNYAPMLTTKHSVCLVAHSLVRLLVNDHQELSESKRKQLLKAIGDVLEDFDEDGDPHGQRTIIKSSFKPYTEANNGQDKASKLIRLATIARRKSGASANNLVLSGSVVKFLRLLQSNLQQAELLAGQEDEARVSQPELTVDHSRDVFNRVWSRLANHLDSSPDETLSSADFCYIGSLTENVVCVDLSSASQSGAGSCTEAQLEQLRTTKDAVYDKMCSPDMVAKTIKALLDESKTDPHAGEKEEFGATAGHLGQVTDQQAMDELRRKRMQIFERLWNPRLAFSPIRSQPVSALRSFDSAINPESFHEGLLDKLKIKIFKEESLKCKCWYAIDVAMMHNPCEISPPPTSLTGEPKMWCYVNNFDNSCPDASQVRLPNANHLAWSEKACELYNTPQISTSYPESRNRYTNQFPTTVRHTFDVVHWYPRMANAN